MDEILKKFYNEIRKHSRVGEYKDLLTEIENAIDGKKTVKEIIIELDGGILQSTYHNIEGLTVSVIDYDTEGMSEDDGLRQISFPGQKLQPAYLYQGLTNKYAPEIVKYVLPQLQ